MSSFGRGHANLLYIVSILSDVLEGTPSLFSHFLFFSSSSDQHQHQLMRFTWKQNLRYYIGFLETLASGARKEAAKARTNPGLVVISRFGVAGFVNSNRDENIRKKSVNGRNEDASSALDPAPPAVPTPSAPPPPVKMDEEEAPKSQGRFGTRFLCVEKKSGQEVACKTIAKRKLTTPVDVEDVRREIQIVHHLSEHPNVIQIVGAYEDAVAIHVVMEIWVLKKQHSRLLTLVSLSSLNQEKHSLMLLGETLLSGVPTLWDETEQGISEQVLKGDI
ncbi:hypothetical protein YC2023_064344 [Brassica napus]